MKRKINILHIDFEKYIYTDMNNDFFNKPLYPPNDFPKENKQKEQQNPFANILSSFGQGSNSQLLSMLLGLKGGKTDLSNILSKKGNPLFEMLSSFGGTKKESHESSPKFIPDDEYLN